MRDLSVYAGVHGGEVRHPSFLMVLTARGSLPFRNEYDGHTIDKSMEQVRRLYDRNIKILAGDRGYRGQEQCGGASVMIPSVPKKTDSQYTKAKKHELFRKRAGIEPVIGHCKSDHRLGRNFYKGLFGDSINVMLAAAAFNFKRAMRALLCLFQEVLSGWIKPFLQLKNLYFWQVPSCYADMRTRELAF